MLSSRCSGDNHCPWILENTFSNVQEIRDALRSDLRPVYAACLVERHPTHVAPNSPELRRLALLTDAAERTILDNWVFLASSQKVIPTNGIAKATFEPWMKRNGRDDFLLKARHPLQRFADDVGQMVCRILAEVQGSRKMLEPEKPAAPSDGTHIRPNTCLSEREYQERRNITAQGIAKLPKGLRPVPKGLRPVPKGLRPKFYSDTAA